MFTPARKMNYEGDSLSEFFFFIWMLLGLLSIMCYFGMPIAVRKAGIFCKYEFALNYKGTSLKANYKPNFSNCYSKLSNYYLYSDDFYSVAKEDLQRSTS